MAAWCEQEGLRVWVWRCRGGQGTARAGGGGPLAACPLVATRLADDKVDFDFRRPSCWLGGDVEQVFERGVLFPIHRDVKLRPLLACLTAVKQHRHAPNL